MPAARTRADALTAYLAGATSAGGAQANPDLSFGQYRSSTRAASLGVLLAAPLPTVRVDFAAPGNGAGVTAQQQLVEGADPSAYLLVTRLTADAMAGTAAVTLTRSFNDVFGQSDDPNVAAPLPTTYRLVVLRAGGAVIRNLKVWLGTCDHVVSIGLESPATQPDGTFQTTASEFAAPAAVTFVQPTSSVHADVLNVPTLAPGNTVGVWVSRTVPAIAAATPRARLGLHWSYTAVG
jgi:hypothetical protein